jgi:16S rRNA (uracil1498-N3)-methyltransferase
MAEPPPAEPPPGALRLFVGDEAAAGAELALPPTAARHVQVRRLQPGEAVVLFDGRGGEWTARVQRIGRREVVVQVGARRPAPAPPTRPVTVAIVVPANERMDWFVEKATELGVAGIQPLHGTRSVLRLDAERAARRHAHWQAIAAAACAQSGRGLLPRIEPMRPLDAWLAALADDGARRLLLSLADDARPAAAVAGAAGALLVLGGPEGGLSADEERRARGRGFAPASLGPAVLRAETAPLALLAWALVASVPGAGAAIGDTAA